MWKLAEYVTVEMNDKVILFRYNKILEINRTNENEYIVNLLIEGKLPDKNDVFMKYQYLDKLINLRFIVLDSIYLTGKDLKTKKFLSHYTNNPDKLLQNAAEKTVCIIGLGGVGSIILQLLLGGGIKHFVLIDADTVEESNFNRQFLYRTTDLGKKKVEVCLNYVKSMSSGGSAKTYFKFIRDCESLRKIFKESKIDLLVCAADQPQDEIKKICFNICQEFSIPYYQGGIGIEYGHFSKNWQKPTIVKKNTVVKKGQIVEGSFGPSNMIISSMMAYDILFELYGLRTDDSPSIIGVAFEELKIINFKDRFNNEDN
ncbi:ThiF family adenylyltransferase [Enterococcus faecalis]|uniref:ThiF family adenylyltransferase n=1 Tax=Enterococcus faecalis TaxID=1351 RepID=UPI0003547455|nr:ThiF family adenylyltransferase [Enterococcus faecalis]EPI31411.1 ThiF family protein [Enterococcus faecalis UP2S-6]MDN3109481.1 ThiF family adenylyltransferase [Enterococcus faecalis]